LQNYLSIFKEVASESRKPKSSTTFTTFFVTYSTSSNLQLDRLAIYALKKHEVTVTTLT